MTEWSADAEHATALTESESRGLLLPVQTRAELNRAEAESVLAAASWLFQSRRRLRPEAIVSENWLVALHRRMYAQVWSWAGTYRMDDRNLGVPYWSVRASMRDVIADTRAWLADPTPGRFGPDECAVRFGYRLVVVHPFPNGNGRWSRLAADALVVSLGGIRFSWGATALTAPGSARRAYISALQVADTEGDLQPLIRFARR